MSIVLFLLVLAGIAVYFTTAEERRRIARLVVEWTAAAIRGSAATDSVDTFLRERVGRPLAAPAVALTCAIVWTASRFDARATPAETLLAWGASWAPSTANGEWWRLVTSTFIHGSFLQLAATLAALAPLGRYLERLVGRLTFLAVFLASGVVAGAVELATIPVTAIVDGASGAVFGLVGLLIAGVVRGYLREPRLPLSAAAVKRLAAGLGIFAAYNLFTTDMTAAGEWAGLATGLVSGLVLTREVVEHSPSPLRSAAVLAGAAVIAIVTTLPLRGSVDPRPFVAQIAEIEKQTAAAYATAVEAYLNGRLQAKALAQIVQRDILPALQSDRKAIETLARVPPEQQAMVADAKQYLDLRETSWHRRVDGLMGSKMKLLRDAETAERGALEALERMQRNAGVAPPS